MRFNHYLVRPIVHVVAVLLFVWGIVTSFIFLSCRIVSLLFFS